LKIKYYFKNPIAKMADSDRKKSYQASVRDKGSQEPSGSREQRGEPRKKWGASKIILKQCLSSSIIFQIF
jgi:hypothetical protein